jgi:hypothetical protein
MTTEILVSIITFLTIFASVSLIRLIAIFVRNLLSNPPKEIVLSVQSLIYYGICISFILTILINKT